MRQADPLVLLEDLVKLLKKHGPESFEALAAMVDSPEFVSAFATILRTVAAQGRSSGSESPKKGNKQQRQASLLERVEDDDPDKYAALSELRGLLMNPGTVPHLRDLHDLGDRLGVGLRATRSRKDAADALIRQLATQSLEEIKRLNSRLLSEAPGGALSDWSDIILPGRKDDK